MTKNVSRAAQVQFKQANSSASVSVPKGTSAEVAAKLLLALAKELRPVGCGACISGIDYNIREHLGDPAEEIANLRVDLNTLQVEKLGQTGH